MNRLALLPIVMVVLVPRGSAQTTFHGNNARTGVYETPGLKQLNGVKWTFTADGPIVASPAIADGVVYIGSLDNYLYALDQETGKRKWRCKTGGPIASSPAVAEGRIYFNGNDGIFYCVTAETGEIQWRFTVEGGERRFEARGIHGAKPKSQTMPDPFDIFTSSPAVLAGRVYFGSGDGNVYALNAQTGALQWKFATKDVVHASPALVDNTVYIGSWDSNLYALDAATGAEKWRFKAGEDPVMHNQVGFQSSPAVVDGTVYVGCRDAHLYALDAATGSQRWNFATNGPWVNTTPAVGNGAVYFATVDSSRFRACDLKTGKVRFVLNTKWGMFSSPALAGDLAYIGLINGKLVAIDTNSGKIAWEFQTESSKKDPLHVMTPNGTRNPTVHRRFYDFQDMYSLWYLNFSIGAIVSSPVVSHGEIYFGSTDGTVYVLH